MESITLGRGVHEKVGIARLRDRVYFCAVESARGENAIACISRIPSSRTKPVVPIAVHAGWLRNELILDGEIPRP